MTRRNNIARSRTDFDENRRVTMLRKITTLALIAGTLAIAACNTVRGAAADVNSVANKVDNAT